MENELAKARKARDAAFERFLEHSRQETKHSVSVRKWRTEYTIASDEVRSLERDILSTPIVSMYE